MQEILLSSESFRWGRREQLFKDCNLSFIRRNFVARSGKSVPAWQLCFPPQEEGESSKQFLIEVADIASAHMSLVRVQFHGQIQFQGHLENEVQAEQPWIYQKLHDNRRRKEQMGSGGGQVATCHILRSQHQHGAQCLRIGAPPQRLSKSDSHRC